MLLNVFSTLGFSPAPIEDGDRAALEADVLFLVGDVIGFQSFAKLLSRRDSRRPTTILWHLNPLPAPALGEPSGLIRLRAAEAWDRRVTLHPNWIVKLIKFPIPVSARSKVIRAINSVVFPSIKKGLDNSPQQSFHGIDTSSRHDMMGGYRRFWRIKRAFFEGWINHVFVSSVPRMEFLTSKGIPAGFAPFGYHPGMGEKLRMERDIDLVFIGRPKHTQRKATLDPIRERLTSQGMNLVTVEGECYGKERTNLLNRACMSLNLIRSPWDLPGIRFLMSMGCGALVVSETLHDPTPYKAGEHFVQASVADLPDAIVHYLENRAEREKIVQSAHNFVTRELTLESTIKQIMGVCGVDSHPPTCSMTRVD